MIGEGLAAGAGGEGLGEGGAPLEQFIDFQLLGAEGGDEGFQAGIAGRFVGQGDREGKSSAIEVELQNAGMLGEALDPQGMQAGEAGRGQ